MLAVAGAGAAAGAVWANDGAQASAAPQTSRPMAVLMGVQLVFMVSSSRKKWLCLIVILFERRAHSRQQARLERGAGPDGIADALRFDQRVLAEVLLDIGFHHVGVGCI